MHADLDEVRARIHCRRDRIHGLHHRSAQRFRLDIDDVVAFAALAVPQSHSVDRHKAVHSILVRYIGNKTKLLRFIGSVLRRRGIRGGQAVDPFSGTASVGRELKRLGFRVIAADLMEYAHVLAKAYVEATHLPTDFARRIQSLNQLPGTPGFITENFSEPARMYFTPANAPRIDAIRTRIHEWRASGEIDEPTGFLLLAALIEASDRVANTTGVYAAYVKNWQPNAVRDLEMRVPRIIKGNSCHAYRADAIDLVSRLDEFDLLYLDPPYNSRQYAGYYHIPELLALGWFDETPELRGKTGLLPDREKRSDWSRRKKCEDALEKLVATARCKHIVMSYSAEGILSEAAIERIFKQYGRAETYQRYARNYRRYRSDSDGANRKYASDRVEEYLYCVSR
jgi:adenine-specific DNA-methyltransferase